MPQIYTVDIICPESLVPHKEAPLILTLPFISGVSQSAIVTIELRTRLLMRFSIKIVLVYCIYCCRLSVYVERHCTVRFFLMLKA